MLPQLDAEYLLDGPGAKSHAPGLAAPQALIRAGGPFLTLSIQRKGGGLEA